MKDLTTFKSYFGGRFWTKLNESLIPFTDSIENKEDFLASLHALITTKEYQPSLPREYIINNKYNLVSRIVPTFCRADYCVYFYCVKALEDFIADTDGRIKGTFGGWRLNSGLSEAESQEVSQLEEQILAGIPSAPDASYNPLAWREHWQEFQKRAFEFGSTTTSNYIIKCDIANFFDCINLDQLEEKVRIASHNTANCEDEIALLFYFLRHWNKKFESYHTKCVGLPQDEVNDCSRILANFYLRSYDKAILGLCERLGAKYLRFADDQLFFARDKQTARFIIFEASKELHKIGLNLNASKVHIFENREDFNTYWAFDIYKLLNDQNKNSMPIVEEAVQKYFEYKAEGKNVKYDSVLKRLLACDLTRLSANLRSKLLSELLMPDYLATCDFRLLKKIFKAFPQQQEPLFLMLDRLINEVRYNSFHYNLKKFYKTYRPDFSQTILDEKIKEIAV